jgi:hypothetical protein
MRHSRSGLLAPRRGLGPPAFVEVVTTFSGVDAGSSVDEVVAAAPADRIITNAADDQIAPPATEESVVTWPPAQGFVLLSTTADEDVVVTRAVDELDIDQAVVPVTGCQPRR